jgi:hypothetical protein
VATESEVQAEAMTLAISAIKAIRDWLDGKAAIEIEQQQAVPNGPAVRRIRFRRD